MRAYLDPRRAIALLKACVTGGALAAMVGCTGASNPFHGPGGFIHPQIGPLNYSSQYQYNPKIADDAADNDPVANFKNLPPFELALAKAERLDNQLYNAMWWNDTYGFLTGAAMYGAGVATLAFGVFDASRTLLLAGGLTTAGLAGVRTFYPFADRNALYSKGRIALQCAVEATRTAVDLSGTLAGTAVETGGQSGAYSLEEILASSQYAALALQTAAADAPPLKNATIPDQVTRALAVQSANDNAASLLDAVAAGRAVQAQMQPTLQASTLTNIVTKIHALVDSQADALSPQPDKALDVARSTLQNTLSGVTTDALKARDLARQVDNQRPKSAKSPTGGAANSPASIPPSPNKDAKTAKTVADKAQQTADQAKKDAVTPTADAAAKNEKARDPNADAGAKADAAEATAKANAANAVASAKEVEAIDKQAKVAADEFKDPVGYASFWAQVLDARMTAIADKLKNIDSCTTALTPSGS